MAGRAACFSSRAPLELYFELLVYFTSFEAFQSCSQHKATPVCVSGSEEVCIPSAAVLSRCATNLVFKVALRCCCCCRNFPLRIGGSEARSGRRRRS